MIYHPDLGKAFESARKLRLLLDNGSIKLGGNKQLKIYGTLNCKSGKRMKVVNRVFFASEQEAIMEGYRPCAHCMKAHYSVWKSNPQLYSHSKTAP